MDDERSFLIQFFWNFSRVTIIPAQDQNARTPQMIVKKINPSGRIVVVNSSVNTSTQQQINATINKITPNIVATTAATTTATANQRGGPRLESFFILTLLIKI